MDRQDGESTRGLVPELRASSPLKFCLDRRSRALLTANLRDISCGSPVPTGVSETNYVVGTRIPLRRDFFVAQRELPDIPQGSKIHPGLKAGVRRAEGGPARRSTFLNKPLPRLVRKAGLEPACLVGATPSRWCVCQFRHFRIRENQS